MTIWEAAAIKVINKISIKNTVGGGYDDFWNDKSRYRVLMGGKGSKKSVTTALNLIYRMMRYPEANTLVVRQVMNTHRDSTFAQLKWAQQKLGVSHLWQNNLSPLEMIYKPTGQKILFRGFDDVLKLASTTVASGYLCWVWIEEAYELPNEADFDKLDLSVPRGQISENLFKQTTLTFNPWSETHWLKKRFFDRQAADVKTYRTNYLINEFLTDTDLAVFENLKQNNRRRYEVAGLGNWGIAEGLVYTNWEVLDFETEAFGPDWQHKSLFGLDYGYANDPTAFIAYVANPITKELFIYDEHYEAKMLNSDIANMIKSKGYAKERIRADAAEPKSNDDLRRLGIQRIQPSVKGKDSVMNGITAICEYKIYVKPKCVNTIKELSSYVYDTDKNENGINKPVDSNNHLMDAMRYAFYDVRFFHPVSPETAKQERQRIYRENTDGISYSDFEGGW